MIILQNTETQYVGKIWLFQG